ncbi:hypothetical protein D3C75_1197430 [compost metagenome]
MKALGLGSVPSKFDAHLTLTSLGVSTARLAVDTTYICYHWSLCYTEAVKWFVKWGSMRARLGVNLRRYHD